MFVALAMTGLAGLVALAINVGHLMAVRTELQSAADSAALAGAQELALNASTRRGTVTFNGEAQARQSASDFSAANQSDGVSIELSRGSEVTFGEFQGSTFTPTGNTSVVNAIRVSTARGSGSPNSPLDVFAWSLLNSSSSANVSATSIAVVGGRCDLTCPILPFAVENCSARPSCGETVAALLSGDGGASWTTFNTLTPLDNIIHHTWTCPQVQVGDSIDVSPPADESDLQAIQNVYAPPSGQRYVVPVICRGLGGQAQILGFTTITLTGVDFPSPPPPPSRRRRPPPSPPPGVTMTFSCGSDGESLGQSVQSGHCTNYGALFTRPRLAQ